jgi:hypothetical protein
MSQIFSIPFRRGGWILFLFLLVPIPICADELRPIDQPKNKRQVTVASEGEDATSATYYFFYKNPDDDTLAKVRMVWNGGAQNKPSITDYYLDGSSVQVVERSAERSALPALLKGQDAPSQILKEYVVKFVGDDSRLTESSGLTREEHMVLGNLISALSMTRKPVSKSSR